MLSAVTSLLTALLGDVFTAWISCDAVEVLLGMLVLGIALKYLITILKF